MKKVFVLFAVLFLLSGLQTYVLAGTFPKLINYQGMLTDTSGNPVTDGSYDIAFKIWDDSTSTEASHLKWDHTYSVSVDNGLFNTILGTDELIDLPFDTDYWLEMEIASVTLSPRARLTSVGYAYHALVADSVSTTTSTSNWSVSDSVLYTKSYWGISRGGAGNIFYGDSAHTMVNLGVECTTGTSGERYSHCTVGGGHGNSAKEFWGTVGGGLENVAGDYRSTVCGGGWNTASGMSAVVAGGENNVASGMASFVGGGWSNTAGQSHVAIAGGGHNSATVDYSSIGGGQYNQSNNTCGTIAGGRNNLITGTHGTIGGGQNNTASGPYSTISGGSFNTVSGQSSCIAGGDSDTVEAFSSFASGSHVKVREDASCTFAFGFNFETNTPNAVIFHNSENEVKVGIGVTNPGNILTVKQNPTTNPVATAWTTYSSRRWKKNINSIPDALDKVEKLRGVYFDWKKNGKHDIGMIAEEVGQVVPEVVAYEENGTDAKSVDYARLSALLVEAIKEQQQEIELLKEKIKALEMAK